MSFPGQPGYNPYSSYNGPQYDFMGGYRNYMSPNIYAQNQPLTGQNQPFANATQMPQQNQNQNIQFALIPSREVAQNATAEKGQTIYMMNQNNPEIYMKAADGFGLQSTRYFKLVEFNPEQENQQNQQMINQNVDYIPREEFNQFAAAVSNELAAIKQGASQIAPALPVATEQATTPVQTTTTTTTPKKSATKGDSK